MLRVPSSAASRRQTSYPSMPGIETSSRIRSGRVLRAMRQGALAVHGDAELVVVPQQPPPAGRRWPSRRRRSGRGIRRGPSRLRLQSAQQARDDGRRFVVLVAVHQLGAPAPVRRRNRPARRGKPAPRAPPRRREVEVAERRRQLAPGCPEPGRIERRCGGRGSAGGRFPQRTDRAEDRARRVRSPSSSSACRSVRPSRPACSSALAAARRASAPRLPAAPAMAWACRAAAAASPRLTAARRSSSVLPCPSAKRMSIFFRAGEAEAEAVERLRAR